MLLRGAAIFHTGALTDEGFTYWRISGTLGQMLDTLRDDAFMPLHYEIVWCLTQLLGQDLWVMRLPAAAAGVMLPFAVARLARVIFGRRAAAPAALLTLASAYFAFFSRNAKMYMPAWLMLALAIGSLLAYARTRRRLAWLTFIFFGVAGGAMHSIVLLPLAVSPVIAAVWAKRKIVRTTFAIAIATALIATGPAIYYSTFNRWFVDAGGITGTIDGRRAPHNNGLDWIENWQSGRSPQNILAECLTSDFTNYEWPDTALTRWPDPNTWAGAAYDIAFGFGALTASIGAGAIVMLLVRRGASADRWRGASLLLLLVALPLYGFYLRSFRDPAAPWDSGWSGLAIVFVAAAIFWRGTRRPDRFWRKIVQVAGGVAIPLVILGVAWLVARIAYAHAPIGDDGLPIWNPVWMPRYAAVVAAPLLATIAGAIAALPGKWLRWLLLTPLLLANLLMTLLPQWYDTQPPFGPMFRDLVRASRDPAVAVSLAFTNGGMNLPSMPGPYYELTRAAGIETDPISFRTGTQWPYVPGPDVLKLQQDVQPHRGDAFELPTADTVVVWTYRRTLSDIPPVRGWRLIDATLFRIFSITDWSEYTTRCRLEYQRITPTPAPATR